MNINEWTAKECGINCCEHTYGFDEPDGTYTVEDDEWCITDARCREIVKEHFKIDTEFCNNNWWAISYGGSLKIWQGISDSIQEAEIACIQEIYEQREK